MPDRVQSLRYKFRSRNEHDRFDDAPPLTTRLRDFDVELRDGSLTATPRRDFEQPRDARDALEPFLRAWQAGAVLDGHDIQFIYEAASVEAESESGQKDIKAELHVTGRATMDAIIQRDNPNYPTPDPALATDAVMAQMLTRLGDARSDDRLLMMNANWMVTRVEQEYGKAAGGSDTRRAAARELNIEHAILATMGGLANRNDPSLGRKAKGAIEPLTPPEVAWMRAAMTALVRQVGRHNTRAHATTPLAMTDLPSLP